MEERVIQSAILKVKLLNGSFISIRPLTLAERKKCLEILPQAFDSNPDKFAEQYIEAQESILHFIISRTNPNFSKEDVNKLLDGSLIEQIVKFALKDPFSEILGFSG